MWCSECNIEFEGPENCPKCGHPLEEMPKVVWGKARPENHVGDWPVDYRGDPVRPVFLTHCSGQNLDDVMLVGLLDAYEYPCFVQYPNDGAFGKLIIGMAASGVDIYVPETMHTEIEALIKEVNHDE